MKRCVSVATLVLLTACFFPRPAICTPSPSPQQVVKNTADQVLRVLEAEQAELRAHPERIYDLVNEYILPNFSFAAMSRLVLGRHWRSATDRQREQFTEAFRSLLVRTYAESLIDYTGVPIRYLATHEDANAKDATVHTEIEPSGRPPVAISYRLRLINGEWKVIDVVVEGVSLVTSYRTEFSTQISQTGLDGLIRGLQARAQLPKTEGS